MGIAFVRRPDWASCEEALAKRLGLEIYPLEDEHLVHEERSIRRSVFAVEDVLAVFEEDRERLMEFGALWYADCVERDYGEELDPAEGNQQPEDRKQVSLGMGQGFLVGYALLYLYAARKPDLIYDYLKAMGWPHAGDCAADVERVYGMLESRR